MSGDLISHFFSLNGQFHHLENMRLSHGLFCTIKAVQNELTEEWETHLAMKCQMLLTCLVDQIEMITLAISPNIDIFSQLNGAISSRDKDTPVPPHAQAFWCEPIHTQVVGCTII